MHFHGVAESLFMESLRHLTQPIQGLPLSSARFIKSLVMKTRPLGTGEFNDNGLSAHSQQPRRAGSRVAICRVRACRTGRQVSHTILYTIHTTRR